MPDVTSEPTNTERVLESGNQGGVVRSFGKGPPMPPEPGQVPLERWSVDRVVQAIRDHGRSVLAVVRDDTLRVKIQEQLLRYLAENVGKPRSPLSVGFNGDTMYWSQDRGFALTNQAPEERLQGTPTETDVVELIIPTDWLK